MDPKQNNLDLASIVFGLLIIGFLIVSSYWIIEPFILGFAWATMVVIATWNLMLRLQDLLWGKRILAVIAMLLLLLLVFILPLSLIISNIINNNAPFIAWIKDSANWQLPALDWLKNIPLIGGNLYSGWESILADGGTAVLIDKIKPYAGQSASWIVLQAVNLGHFMIHTLLMLIFSALLYYSGESVSLGVRKFALRLAPIGGEAAVILAAQSIRAVALGIVVTAFVQAVLGGFGLYLAGINYPALLTIIMFICCLAQLGPLFILLPCVLWLYWNGDATIATLLLIWSAGVATLDGFLRPILIRKGANLPFVLILSGVIGGLLAFGMIGLFIGPVVLAVSYRLLSAWVNGDEYKMSTINEQNKHTKSNC